MPPYTSPSSPNTPEMNRSRRVHNPRYQIVYLTPSRKKVTAFQKSSSKVFFLPLSYENGEQVAENRELITIYELLHNYEDGCLRNGLRGGSVTHFGVLFYRYAPNRPRKCWKSNNWSIHDFTKKPEVKLMFFLRNRDDFS